MDLPNGQDLYVFSLPETSLEGNLKALVYVEIASGEKLIRKLTPRVHDTEIDTEGFLS